MLSEVRWAGYTLGGSHPGLHKTLSLTSQWSRRPTAFAPASLRLLGAAHRWRSVTGQKRKDQSESFRVHAHARRADQVYSASHRLWSHGFSRRMACPRFPISQAPIACSSTALIVTNHRMSTCVASGWCVSFGWRQSREVPIMAFLPAN